MRNRILQATRSTLKRVVRKILRSRGFDIIPYNIDNSNDFLLNWILKSLNIQTVIDVGANEGQYASTLIENGYTGVIYSFEPISHTYELLKKRAERNRQWHAFNLGIGAKEDQLTIHVSENYVSSSILQVEEKSLRAEPTTRTVREEKINVTSIDSFFTGHHPLQAEVLLKLDIQGFEMEALKGALNTLKKFKLIQVELSFVPLYKGAPLFEQMVRFMNENGFEIFDIHACFRDPASGQMLQSDGLFIRKEY